MRSFQSYSVSHQHFEHQQGILWKGSEGKISQCSCSFALIIITIIYKKACPTATRLEIFLAELHVNWFHFLCNQLTDDSALRIFIWKNYIWQRVDHDFFFLGDNFYSPQSFEANLKTALFFFLSVRLFLKSNLSFF